MLALAEAHNQKARAERNAAELREDNIRIQEQLILTKLNVGLVSLATSC